MRVGKGFRDVRLKSSISPDDTLVLCTPVGSESNGRPEDARIPIEKKNIKTQAFLIVLVQTNVRLLKHLEKKRTLPVGLAFEKACYLWFVYYRIKLKSYYGAPLQRKRENSERNVHVTIVSFFFF